MRAFAKPSKDEIFTSMYGVRFHLHLGRSSCLDDFGSMQNLRCVTARDHHLAEADIIAWDASSDSIIYAISPTESTPVLRLKRHGEPPQLITSWDAPRDDVLLLQHFSDETCIVLAGGDVVVVREHPSTGQDKIEIVGSVDSGITTAAWSPDEELLAIVTQADTLILMSRDFEPATEATLTADDLQTSRHISVGWGKKETQFHGKGTRALHDPTIPETVDEGKLSEYDDNKCTVAWRGDGAFLAINSIVEHRRVVRVFTRDAVLDSVSEPVDGMESALSWQPSGNLIASVQRLQDRVDVVFFERNGLRHGQFSLRLSKEDMKSWASTIALSWNIDSTVLAVIYRDRVQLWTVSNYHYYLKQEIPTTNSTHASSNTQIRWHPEQPLRCCIQAGRMLLNLEFAFSVNRGSTTIPQDDGMVAVIDGKELKITPFKFATIPPPMAFTEISTESSILDCSISVSGDIIAILTISGVDLYWWDLTKRPQLILEKRVLAPSDLRRTPYVRAWCPRIDKIMDRSEVILEDRLQAPGDLRRTPYLRPLCPRESWVQYYSAEGEVPEMHIEDLGRFSLSKRAHLISDGKLISKDCTSFATTGVHLIFTTSQHLLKFVELATMDVPPDVPDERCRTIERGAKIVTVIPSNYAVILQMPRGNLETVFPRVLVVAGIRQHLDQKDYKSAYMACCAHQVDMNIMHLHNPESFIIDIPRFVAQVKKVTRLDNFLSKLKEDENCNTSNVNRICDTFLSVLAGDIDIHFQNLVTAHVCKRPPELDASLKLIADLRKDDTKKANAAVEHLCFLADINRLYDTALSLYDLELALLVAQQSQKDPREYIPFLQSLQCLPVLRRRFLIDDHLRNYPRALRSLHLLNLHDEIDAYTVKHSLYTRTIAYYANDRDRLAIITALYASHLQHSTSHYHEAAIQYQSIGDFSSSSSCYARAHRWQESIACARRIPMPLDQLQELARSLAATCIEDRDYRAAAEITWDVLADVPEAARLLCKGSFFIEAE